MSIDPVDPALIKSSENSIAYYRRILEDLEDDLDIKKSVLKQNFNFGIAYDEGGYNDYWDSAYTLNLPTGFSEQMNDIVSRNTVLEDLIKERFSDIMMNVNQLDNYLCNAAEVFSRAIDTIFDIRGGGIYQTKYDATYIDEDGGYVTPIKLKKLNHYVDLITQTTGEISAYIDAMLLDKDNIPNNTTGINPHRNEIELLIRKFEGFYDSCILEFQKIQTLLDKTDKFLTKDIRKAHKILVVVSITFSLSAKMEKLQDKVNVNNTLYDDELARRVSKKAREYKATLSKDQTNREKVFNACILELYGGEQFMEFFEIYLDDTWDQLITVY